MKLKDFILVRLEESRTLKRVRYDVRAENKKEAISKVRDMNYTIRDTIDEIRETNWKAHGILSVDEV